MQWLISALSQIATMFLEADIHLYKFLQLASGVGHDLKTWYQWAESKLESLKGIRSVSELMKSMESRSPMGPTKYVEGSRLKGSKLSCCNSYECRIGRVFFKIYNNHQSEKWRKEDYVPQERSQCSPWVWSLENLKSWLEKEYKLEESPWALRSAAAKEKQRRGEEEEGRVG